MFRYAISAIFRGAGPESKSRSARVEFVRALCVRFRLIDTGPTARLRAQADGEVLSRHAGRNVHRAACADAVDAAVDLLSCFRGEAWNQSLIF